MDGTQKTVHDGLVYLAGKVADGFYGEGDDAFQLNEDGDSVGSSREAFCEDYEEHVLNKMD